jgi:primosomal protein N' (replication factor Y)
MQILSVLIEYNVSSLNRPFSYIYKGEKEIKKGTRVIVPFNNRNIVGYVVDIEQTNLTIEEIKASSPFDVKEVTKIVDDEPLFNDELESLAKKVADYYLPPLISVYQTMLPPSLKPKKSALSKPKIQYDQYLVPLTDNEDDLTAKQLEIFRLIKDNYPVLKNSIKSAAVSKLIEKNKVNIILKEKIRLVQKEVKKTKPLSLNDEQKRALHSILDEDYKTYLLEGVTGSGKTEVYLQAAEDYISRGKSVLVLVPEISLTVQMVHRFKSRFDNIAILHSELTPAEKYDEYRRISRGEVNVVVGARSAIFAPIKNLGLIIIDEEHVETYKQENQPFYNALKVAQFRQEYHNCKIILGSATPSLETKTRALKGIFHQLYLTKRINDGPLPETKVINMLDYRNIDNDSTILSLELRKQISDRLNKKEQVMLLINRRGFAPFIQCKKCRMTFKCPTCSLPLSYHQKDDMIKCHHCGYVAKMPKKCPKCEGDKFYKIGFGSEKVESEVKNLFPSAKVLRLDSDTTQIRNKTSEILTAFENHEADILIGTQMIAKGHDFKDVTLVGIVLADLGLNIPSWMSSERTFNLITQAVGRAGRDIKPGLAIIQTYDPNNYVIYDASKQDYNRFFNEEMLKRKAGQYPPYRFLSLIKVASSSEDDVIDGSAYLKNFLVAKFAKKDVDVLGPSEPFLVQLNGKFYRKILIKYKKYSEVKPILEELINISNKRKNLSIQIDVDPYDDY